MNINNELESIAKANDIKGDANETAIAILDTIELLIKARMADKGTQKIHNRLRTLKVVMCDETVTEMKDIISMYTYSEEIETYLLNVEIFASR